MVSKDEIVQALGINQFKAWLRSFKLSDALGTRTDYGNAISLYLNYALGRNHKGFAISSNELIAWYDVNTELYVSVDTPCYVSNLITEIDIVCAKYRSEPRRIDFERCLEKAFITEDTILNELELDKFAQWIGGRPDDRPIARRVTSDACPISQYLTSVFNPCSSSKFCQGIILTHFMGMGGDVVVHDPAWVQMFVCDIDQWPTTGNDLYQHDILAVIERM